MKARLCCALLALSPCLAIAEEVPHFIVTSARLTPALPAWVNTDDFDDEESTPGMCLTLAAKYQITKPQNDSPCDAQQYAVNENDEWSDWEEDTEDSAPVLINAHFEGSLRDAAGKELLPTKDNTEENIQLSDSALYWELISGQLPDTMQLLLDGTLNLTILEKGETTITPTIPLKPTANNYAWGKLEGYTLSLTIGAAVEETDDEEQDDWEEDEEEADFDTIDDSEIPAPIPQTSDLEKSTNELRIEAEGGLLDAIRAIIIITPDGTEERILKDKVIDEVEESLIITNNALTPQHQFRLELYSVKTTRSHKLHQPLYLNGKK
ncbi:MAG: hypothetical protein II295_07670 [Akkermansia sp.]|nr:hypothetical protein [Akkermansia sp.]